MQLPEDSEYHAIAQNVVERGQQQYANTPIVIACKIKSCLCFFYFVFFFSSKQQIDHCDRQYLIFTGLRQIPGDANNLLFNLVLAFSAYRTFSYLSENKFVWQRDFKW